MKNVLEYSDQEIEKMYETNPQLAVSIKGIYLNMKGDLEAELSRLNIMLSDFTQRSAALMTVSGLLTFLPSLINFQTDYLQYFLIFTFPFLLFAIVAFYFSSVRVHAFATQIPFASSGSSLEIVILKHKVDALQDIWKLNLDNYNQVLEWYRGVAALLYTYIISFSINLYYFVFIGKPDLCVSIIIVSLVILLGLMIFNRGKEQSKKDVHYGPSGYGFGIGGPADPSI